MQESKSEEPNYITVTDDTVVRQRAFFGAISGAIGAVVGLFGSGVYISNKLIPFDREVAARTRKDIMGRGGLGAGFSEAGGFSGSMGSGIIEEAHALDLIQNPEFSFAKRIRQIGGRGTAEFIAAGVAGVAAMGAYFMLTPKREPETKQIPAPPECRLVQNGTAEGHQSDSVLHKNESHEQSKNWQDTVRQETKGETQEPARS